MISIPWPAGFQTDRQESGNGIRSGDGIPPVNLKINRARCRVRRPDSTEILTIGQMWIFPIICRALMLQLDHRYRLDADFGIFR